LGGQSVSNTRHIRSMGDFGMTDRTCEIAEILEVDRRYAVAVA
jgi:hypothetical protein